MLLLETTLIHVVAALESDRPIAIVPAHRPDQGDQDTLECAKGLATAARDAGFSFHVIEGRWTASGAPQRSVLVVADVNTAAHLLGRCRKWMREFEQNVFLFRNAESLDILQIVADGSRKGAVVGRVRLESGRLTLPDGRSFTFERAFQAAGWLTAMAHSRGAAVGATL